MANDARNNAVLQTRRKNCALSVLFATLTKPILKDTDHFQELYTDRQYKMPFCELSIDQKAEVHRKIIESAGRTNTEFNTMARISLISRDIMAATGGAIAVASIFLADRPLHRAVNIAFSIVGGYLGGYITHVCGLKWRSYPTGTVANSIQVVLQTMVQIAIEFESGWHLSERLEPLLAAVAVRIQGIVPVLVDRCRAALNGRASIYLLVTVFE
ncbi:hypothetical protein FN846DRAFT_914228 [Sphaerosporella brunnea]|uniref:Uncharacterized protein n=1 Tax=Sphaerosporella brunnea TaxID=1250544 RepID=A0A5J5EE99_9PEZI|nr:hypothetical protein FN846DRAFT_914228 [Sphaerosporella brunnea]